MTFLKKASALALIVVLFVSAVDASQKRLRIRIGPTATSSSGDLSEANIEWLGQKSIPADQNVYNDASSGKIAAYTSGGQTRLLISSNGNQGQNPGPNYGYRWTPVEYVDPAVYDTDGSCLSNCPSTGAIASAPALTYKGSWNGTYSAPYDFFHGKVGCYGDGVECQRPDGSHSGSTLLEACPETFSGYCLGLTNYFVIPGTTRLIVSWGGAYGVYQSGGNFVICELTTAPVSTGLFDVAPATAPVSSCAGPFVNESPATELYTDAVTSGNRFKGLMGASYWVALPDSGYGWGGKGPGSSYQQGTGPGGPSLFRYTGSLPAAGSTSVGPGNPIVATGKLLMYYTLDAYATQQGAGPLSIAPINPGFRHNDITYPYVLDTIDCSRAWNQAASSYCASNPSSRESSDGSYLAINPRTNGGVGSMGESDNVAGMVVYDDGVKSGALVFITSPKSLTSGSSTSCATKVHQGYCDGSKESDDGTYCSDPDAGGPKVGNSLSHEFACAYINQSTGPSNTGQLPQILVYSWNEMKEVEAGTRTDYSLEPKGWIYPMTEMDSDMAFSADGFNGAGRTWSGVAQHPTNPRIIYAVTPVSWAGGIYQHSLQVFRIKDVPAPAPEPEPSLFTQVVAILKEWLA